MSVCRLSAEPFGGHKLRVSDVDVSLFARSALEKVSVEASLLSSLGVQSVDLLPILVL